jgi:hypothetical protein
MVNLNIESELCKDLICNPNDRQRNSQEHREGTLIMSKGSRILIVDDEPDVLELLPYVSYSIFLKIFRGKLSLRSLN